VREPKFELVPGNLYVVTREFSGRLWVKNMKLGDTDFGIWLPLLLGDLMLFIRTRDDGKIPFDEFLTRHGILGRGSNIGISWWITELDTHTYAT
jgi:hypothetical protein